MCGINRHPQSGHGKQLSDWKSTNLWLIRLVKASRCGNTSGYSPAPSSNSACCLHIHNISMRIADCGLLLLLALDSCLLFRSRRCRTLAIGLRPGCQDKFMVPSFERDNCAGHKENKNKKIIPNPNTYTAPRSYISAWNTSKNKSHRIMRLRVELC